MDESQLRILEIAVISASIIFAAFLSWLLSAWTWRRDRRERLVSEVLVPLVEEVDRNLVRAKGMSRVAQTDTESSMLSDDWKGIRRNPLWLGLPKKYTGQGESLYDGMERYVRSVTKARMHYWNILGEILSKRLLRDGVEYEQFQPEIEMGFGELYREGFGLYYLEGWVAVRDGFHEVVSGFVQGFCESQSDSCRTSVSAEDLLRSIGLRVKSDSAMGEFASLRLSILKDGEKFKKDLDDLIDRELKSLYWKMLKGS